MTTVQLGNCACRSSNTDYAALTDETWLTGSKIVHLSEDALIETDGADSSDDEDIFNLERAYHDDSDGDLPTATASALTESLIPGSQTRDRSYTFHLETGVAYSRAEFLFARIRKSSPSEKVGLRFKPVGNNSGVVISWIDPNGLFAKSNLCVGDRVLSVNGKAMLLAKATKVAQAVAMAPRWVDIIVRHKGGDPHIVSTSIQRSSGISKFGVALKTKRGALVVSRINGGGVFAQSLLQPGHRCLSINDLPCDGGWQLKEAAKWISMSREFCTIVSRPQAESAVVLACEAQRTLWTTLALGFGVLAGAASAVQSLG
jgi:hypothetical protein